MRRLVREDGQAAVEFVALLPVIFLVAAGVWQLGLAGHTLWTAHSAARAAARTQAVGGDPVSEARKQLAGMGKNAKIKGSADGDVTVRIRIPEAVPGLSVGHVSATAHFEPQKQR